MHSDPVSEYERSLLFVRLSESIRLALRRDWDGVAYGIDWTALQRVPARCNQPTWESYNEQYVRCRRCDGCLEARRREWVARMVREGTRWPRKWFVTLTHRPGVALCYSDVQTWLKRLRKRCRGVRLRFVCTAEQGSLHGRLHYHVLLYSTVSVRWRDLCETWKSGYSTAKLVKDPKGAFRYVAKYLAKAHGKVRASLGFGKGEIEGAAASATTPPLESDASSSQPEGGAKLSTKPERAARGGGAPPTRAVARVQSGATSLIASSGFSGEPVCMALWVDWMRGRGGPSHELRGEAHGNRSH